MRKVVGYECGAAIKGSRRIDEFEKTQHYTFYASDLLRAKDLGVEMIRYGADWHRVETHKGHYDWKWLDGVLDLMKALNIEPIMDMCHFGTPDWLAQQGGFACPDFPEHLCDYIKAFMHRYPHVRYFTCVNEPLITARFCGRHAIWHPHRTDAFELIRDILIEAICRGADTIRAIRPDAIIMQNDNGEHHTAGHTNCAACDARAEELNEERFYIWEKTRGYWDILGIDYYPWTEEVHWCDGRKHTHCFRGLYALVKECHERFSSPIMIAETDHSGSVEIRMAWLESTLSDCARLMQEGVPMFGYTWWPLVDNINWGDFRELDTPDNAGLYSLTANAHGQWQREATPLAARYKLFMDCNPVLPFFTP